MWPRILELERRIEELTARLARDEQQLRQMGQGTTIVGGGGSSGGGFVASYWCLTPSAISAATGSWPSITPTTFSSNVYMDVAGSLVLVTSSATVYWWYKDAEVINKLVPCSPNFDGSFDAIASSCTVM